MTASAVFILDVKGKVIISRNYRGDVPMNCVERFAGHVLEAEEADERPVWLEHGTTYVYIKYNNLYIMAVTQRNSNAAMILLFLYRLVEVLNSPPITRHIVSMPSRTILKPSRTFLHLHTAFVCTQLHRLAISYHAIVPGTKRLFQGARGGVYSRQFRDHLRIDGRDDGFRLPADI
jgi:hypothetical protein